MQFVFCSVKLNQSLAIRRYKMKKVVKEEKDEFLYPGDVFVGILGEDCKYKIEDFLKKVIAKARYKNMKLIYNKLYTFLEWKPKGSSMAYEAILEDVVHNGERHLSFVCGFPFLEGKKQKMEITCIQGHKEHNRLEGYVGLSFISDAQDMMAYNPCFALQRSIFYHLKPNKKGKYKVNVCMAGLALSIKKTPRTIIKVDKGGFYETTLKDFLENNPGKTQADFPCAEVDASHMSALFGKEIKDEYEYVSDIYSVKKFKFNDSDFYRLEIEVLRNSKTDKGMKIYLYVNRELLGEYEPKVKDNIHGIMQLTAYLDEKECAKIMEASMETGEVITEKGRFQYKLEVPASEDEFSNGLAFRDSLAPQTGMLYLYDNEFVSMYTPQTKLPVDYIFADMCGNIMKVAKNVKPLSYERHACHNTRAVLEINKGEAEKFGIKEGDILLNKHLFPNFDYGKLTIKNADKYFRYDNDLYAQKDGMLYFYSLKSHAWNAADNNYRKKITGDRIKCCSKMGIERVDLTEEETERLMKEYENELRFDYAKTLKRYYRLCEKLFYSHDEVNNKYQLYTFKNGWTDVDWLSDAHKVIDPFRTIAMKMTSDNVKKLIKQYQKSVKDNNYKDDDDNLVYMHYNEGKEGKDKFYLIFGGTLWRINDENKIYETYDATRNGWSDMAWLGDKLEHEVRCAKHLGQELTHEEMLKKCQDLYETTQKRLKEKNNGGG